MSRHLILVSDASKTCGVEEFARQTAWHLDENSSMQVLGAPGLREALTNADDLVINLPVVAWKRKLLAPIAAALQARSMGKQVTIVLHEWADLALARRVSYLPLLPLATRLLFSSPEVKSQFASTPLSAVVTKDRGIVPIPPNFAVPEWTRETPLSRSLAADRENKKLILAQFGSIYPKKDPLVLLEVAEELVRRGEDTRVVFIGSFIGEGIEQEFWQRVDAVGLRNRVEVTGYVATAEELYGLFAEVDVFLYPLSEGLTSRRASVLAAALSGRPVVVSAPERADSVDHHPLFKALLKRGTIQLAPRGASAGALADAVLAARATPARPLTEASAIDAVWDAAIARLEA